MEENPILKASLSMASDIPLYAQLTGIIKNTITSGTLRVGDLLPSEAELCDKFEISRNTVRQAIGSLEEAGFVVRKRGSAYFMLPGGKSEPGETPIQTLQRELWEELGLQLAESEFQSLGHHSAPAANEPGHWVEAEVFQASLTQAVKVQAELEELDWLGLPPARTEHLAPLLREKILPLLEREDRLSLRFTQPAATD